MTETVIILLQSVRLFMFLTETEYSGIHFQDPYSCNCQDTVMFASYAGYAILMSKTNCSAKFPCFFGFQGNRQRNTKQPEHFTSSVSATISPGTERPTQETWTLT